MNKVEKMRAVFENREPDHVPVGFWFHYPANLNAEQRAQAHVDLCRDIGTDIIKLMDDNFGHFLTEGIKISKPSDWRSIRLPGRDCSQYRNMTELIQRVLDKTQGEMMVFPTMWSPFKIGSFTYLCAGSTDQQFMQHCEEDPESVIEGMKIITESLKIWTRDYLELGSSGIYYSGQFSEPQRFSEQTWSTLVKPFDLEVLNITCTFSDKYNIVHICGEVEFNFNSSPQRYVGYPGDLFNWDVHRSGVSLQEGRSLFNAPILASVYKGILNKNSIMDCQPTEFTALTRLRGGFFMGQRKEVSLPRGLTKKVRPFFHAIK